MRQPEQRGCKYWQSTTTIPLHQGILRQTARYCGLSFQNFVPSDFGMSMFCNKIRKKTQENRSFPGKRITFLSLAELRCATGGFETVLAEKIQISLDIPTLLRMSQLDLARTLTENIVKNGYFQDIATGRNAAFTTGRSSWGLLYLIFA